MPGYRDSTDSHIPILVRMYWLNDAFPEIMDREFHLIHSASANLGTMMGELTRFPLSHIEFTMHDDDPQIQDGSLRLEEDDVDEGRVNVTGNDIGDERLSFTCFGCGACFT